jgi:hypothetical protein
MPTLIAFDTETYKIEPGTLAPKGVVGSYFDGSQGWLERFPSALETIEGLLTPGRVIAGANIAYDWAVIAAEKPGLLRLVFEKYRRGEVFDVQIAAALDAVAEGRMLDGMVLDRNGAPLRKHGETGPITNRFSLENCVWLYLGRRDAKQNDEYRLRYGELDALPIEQWPESAKQYPVDDAKNTYDVAKVQRTTCQNLGPISAQFAPAPPLLPHTHQTHNARAAWVMHLGSVWGFRTDAERIEKIEAKLARLYAEGAAYFQACGFIKTEGKDAGKKNTKAIKREVALAFGTDPNSKCPKCGGTGKVASEKTGKPVNCKACDSTGLALASTVPLTDGDGISCERDTLEGSENERLVKWAELARNDKMRDTYLPWLKGGLLHAINDRPNPLIATGRCSYEGLVQLVPPDARECIKARPGRAFLSCDYPSLELCTLAQATFWTVGFSRMREVINETGDPGALHTEFGAKMAGVDISSDTALHEFKKRCEDKASAEYRFRFMAKAGNFGFPGGMGPPKLVLAKRKEGLRFCVASGVNERCAPAVMEWRGKVLDKPTCPDCLEIAAKLREDWFLAWPEIKPYFDWVGSIPGIKEGHGVITTPGTGYTRGGLSFTNAANHTFQHLGAYAAKEAAWRVGYEAYTDRASPLWGFRPLILVHDEIFGEIPIKTAHEGSYRVCDIMQASLQAVCPDVKIPKPEPALMLHWYKKATAVFDESGKLIPWAPTVK